MDYGQIYSDLIERGLTRTLGDGVYVEKHHVWPKCMGGPDEASNLVKLTPEEHFLAHQLLVKMFPDNKKLVFACTAMSMDKNGRRINNKIYGWIKKRIKHSEETKRKMSQSKRNMSEETRRNMSQAAKGKIRGPHSEEARRNMSQAATGRKHSEETLQKLSKAKKGKPSNKKGKPMSEEQKVKLKEAWVRRKQRGDTPWNKGLKLASD